MKVCYLILAHNNFSHLTRLIEALGDKDATFCIHIDQKSTRQFTTEKKNVAIIPQHKNINWGGYAMIEATLALLQYGYTNNADADYYILLSGVDYPIRSREFLYNQLAKGKEFIDCAPTPFMDKPMGRFEYYYFDVDRRKHGYFHPKIMSEIAMRIFKLKRKLPFKIFVGGQWFALTRPCVQYILDVTEKDKQYESFFRNSLIPDEAFIQTIIATSPFANNLAPNMTFTDWTGPNPPVKIEDRHIDLLRENSEFEDEYGIRHPCFARKFDDNSEAIITRIEKELRK